MGKKFFFITAFFILSTALPASAGKKPDSEGLWLTENKRFVISVDRCAETLCGTIYWIAADIFPFDIKNADPAQRANPLCGMNILWGFRQRDERNWVNGTVYRYDTGVTYQATLEILPTGNVLMRGYIFLPLFSKSEILTPVSPKDYPKCRNPMPLNAR